MEGARRMKDYEIVGIRSWLRDCKRHNLSYDDMINEFEEFVKEKFEIN